MTEAVQEKDSYPGCPVFAVWTAARRWISFGPERCSSGSPSPEQTERTAGPRSAWPELKTETEREVEAGEQLNPRQTRHMLNPALIM